MKKYTFLMLLLITVFYTTNAYSKDNKDTQEALAQRVSAIAEEIQKENYEAQAQSIQKASKVGSSHTAIDVSTNVQKRKKTITAKKTSENLQEDFQKNPKEQLASYGKNFAKFKSQIERGAWQNVHADTRTFVAFARNYANRIHCDGVLSDIIYPQDKGLEIKILNEGHDAFLRVSSAVPQEYNYFPIDINFICEGNVYQVNGVVDSKYPAMNIELIQNKELQTQELLRKNAAVIQKASAMPHEEKITKIMQRIFQDDAMSFWSKKNSITKHENKGVVFYLRQETHTNIDNIVAWDFAVEKAEASVPELIEILRSVVPERIISLGRVIYPNGQRVIILSAKEKGEGHESTQF